MKNTYFVHLCRKFEYFNNPILGINNIDIMHEIVKNLLKLCKFFKKIYQPIASGIYFHYHNIIKKLKNIRKSKK